MIRVQSWDLGSQQLNRIDLSSLTKSTAFPGPPSESELPHLGNPHRLLCHATRIFWQKEGVEHGHAKIPKNARNLNVFVTYCNHGASLKNSILFGCIPFFEQPFHGKPRSYEVPPNVSLLPWCLVAWMQIKTDIESSQCYDGYSQSTITKHNKTLGKTTITSTITRPAGSSSLPWQLVSMSSLS